ncbi:hypothetical protein [Micromonospora sp. CA-111912]|uniref:hypothetical protein n=1 Tax=Micromonospora sp. CA-111912 TaxID=3239955 RepID=UPI003D8CFDC1
MYDDMDHAALDWYDGDEPLLEAGTARLYLDFGGDFARMEPVLQLTTTVGSGRAGVRPDLGPDDQ